MRLIDAEIREQACALEFHRQGKFPKEISYGDLLDHGVYDLEKDEITLAVKGVGFTYKVQDREW